ncbi:MAG: hypothetical protein H8E14_17030 [Candidatus Marinimicrobia bacterium]|nr:hypothetical protein [Candidatus Neomarinimicrobiota bacterium]
MLSFIGLVVTVVVIILLFDLLDISDAFKQRILGEKPGVGINARLEEIEKRLTALEEKKK